MNASFTVVQKSCYLIKGDKGFVLIDTGTSNKSGKILKALTSQGGRPEDLKLIIITHTHFDHVGSLAALKKLTAANVLIHKAEAENLEKGYTEIPKGAMQVARTLAWLSKRFYILRGNFECVQPDITITDNYDLADHGLRGNIIHTPGHTLGSISVALEGQYCFVGDTLFNIFPGSIYPPFANHPELLCQSWQRLLDTGCEFFHPAHGRVIGRKTLIKHCDNLKSNNSGGIKKRRNNLYYSALWSVGESNP